jgi:hypothetical protein
VPNSANPAWAAGAAASASIPSAAAARQTSAGSPVGSAAASSSSRWLGRGRAAIRRSKFCSMLRASGSAPGSPKPPASPSGVSSRGSSSSASGLPRASAMIWSLIRPSMGAARAASSSTRASASGSPATVMSGSPASSRPGFLVAKTSPIDSAPSRRATNASTSADARSSHCWSSTRHSSGRSSATPDSRPSTARPTRNRSGVGSALCPKTPRSASRCGVGNTATWSSIRAHS